MIKEHEKRKFEQGENRRAFNTYKREIIENESWRYKKN